MEAPLNNTPYSTTTNILCQFRPKKGRNQSKICKNIASRGEFCNIHWRCGDVEQKSIISDICESQEYCIPNCNLFKNDRVTSTPNIRRVEDLSLDFKERIETIFRLLDPIRMESKSVPDIRSRKEKVSYGKKWLKETTQLSSISGSKNFEVTLNFIKKSF